jgi:hypothetical protein
MPTIVFHGSDEEPAFRLGHEGTNSCALGQFAVERWGAFFTDNPAFAGLYGRARAYELDLGRTVRLDGPGGRDVVYEFLDGLAPHSAEREVWLRAREVAGGRLPLWHLFDGDLGRRFHAHLTGRGFDSAAFYEANEDEDGDEHESRTVVVLDVARIVRAPSLDPAEPMPGMVP